MTVLKYTETVNGRNIQTFQPEFNIFDFSKLTIFHTYYVKCRYLNCNRQMRCSQQGEDEL